MLIKTITTQIVMMLKNENLRFVLIQYRRKCDETEHLACNFVPVIRT